MLIQFLFYFVAFFFFFVYLSVRWFLKRNTLILLKEDTKKSYMEISWFLFFANHGLIVLPFTIFIIFF